MADEHVHPAVQSLMVKVPKLLFTGFLLVFLMIPTFASPASAVQEETQVEVSLYEWGIDMEPDTIPAGTVRFRVSNDGDRVHNFRIEGEGIRRRFRTNLQPGDVRIATTDLEAGTYTITCPVGSHAEQGMQATLTVGESQENGTVPQTGGEPVDTVRSPIEETLPIGLEDVAEGLTAPVAMAVPGDDSGRLFIVDQTGLIRVIDENGDLLEEPFLDVRDRLVNLREQYDERGLLGLAFHPQYTDNGRFFVYYSAPLREGAPSNWNHTSHLSEFQVSEDDPNLADPDSEQILMRIDQPQSNHDGGTVLFGPDGYLYISLGDGGGADDTGTGHVMDWYEENDGGNGQDIEENLLGSILRIDVDNGDPYGIPEDNPFVDGEGLDEIYAYGFRNPYRFSFDREGDNQLFVGDAGQNLYEEVSIVEAGGNYGWNVKEGTHCFSTDNPNSPPEECPGEDPDGNPLIDPIIEYVNGNQPDGVGLVVVGGYMYRGDAIEDLQGRYVFGDWSTSFQQPAGLLMAAEPREEGLWPVARLVVEGQEEEGFGHFLLAFGEDQEGELYVLTSDSTGPSGSTGRVFRIVTAP